jgi:hypothetical protein
MATEVIITEFRAEVGQFTAAIDKAEASVTSLDQSEKDAQKSTQGLSLQLGSAAAKVSVYRTAVDAISSKTKEASVAFKQLSTATGGTIPALRALGKELAVIASDRFPKLSGAFNGLKNGLGQVGGAIKGAASGIADYSKQVAGSIPVVGNLLLALGPIGIAAGVVAAGLFKIFTNLDAGATAVDGFRRSAGVAFDQVTGASKRLFDQLTEGDSVSSKVFKTIASGIASVTIGPLINAFNALFSSAIDAGQEIAVLYDNLDEAQRGNIVQSAKARQEIARLTIQLKDRTKTEEERLAIADQITSIETQAAKDRQVLLKQETAAIQRTVNEQIKAKGEADDANLTSLENAKAAEVEAQTESIQILERTELRRNAITEQGQAERNAIAAKEAEEEKKRNDAAVAARAKRDAEIQKLDEARVAAATQTANLEAELAQRAELSGLEGVEKRVREVELGYEKERQAATKLFDELSKLYPDDADKRAEIAQQSATVIAAITTAEVAATKEIRDAASKEEQEKAAASLENVRSIIVSREVLEREAINKRFEDAKEDAKKTITDAQELSAALVAIEAARVKATGDIRTEEQIRDAELQQQRVDVLVNTGKTIQSLAEGIGSGAISSTEEVGKALLDIAFQTLSAYADIALAQSTIGSLAQPDSIASFGALGIARAAIIGALIKGALAALRSQLAGSFYEGGIVGRDGGTKVHGGRDGYIANVHKGEHIMPTDKTRKYLSHLEMMRDGSYDGWVRSLSAASNYTTSSPTIKVDPYNDRRLVGAMSGVGSLREQRKQTELLAMVASGLRRGTNARYTA